MLQAKYFWKWKELLEHISWLILLFVKELFSSTMIICKCVNAVSYSLIYENLAGGLERASEKLEHVLEKHTLEKVLYGFHIKLDKASYLAPRLLTHRMAGISREFWQGESQLDRSMQRLEMNKHNLPTKGPGNPWNPQEAIPPESTLSED